MRKVSSVISQWFICMLQSPPQSPNHGNKQAETLEGSIDVCSFMRTYHSRPIYAQKRSNEILTYQIEFFAWLISFRVRRCAHTCRIQNIFRFPFTSEVATEPRIISQVWFKYSKRRILIWYLRFGSINMISPCKYGYTLRAVVGVISEFLFFKTLYIG